MPPPRKRKLGRSVLTWRRGERSRLRFRILREGRVAIRLIDAAWGKEISDALRADAAELRVICPFIKGGTIECFDVAVRDNHRSKRNGQQFN